jgi:hypothetical protein
LAARIVFAPHLNVFGLPKEIFAHVTDSRLLAVKAFLWREKLGIAVVAVLEECANTFDGVRIGRECAVLPSGILAHD